MTATSAPFTPPSIVVGVDGSRAALQAARWAADEATSRDLPLHLVAVARTDAGYQEAHAAVQAAAVALAEAGSPVPVSTEVATGEPAQALLAAARSAVMLCVGAVGIEYLEGRVRSTVHALVAAAHCPLAVVRSPSPVGRGTEHPNPAADGPGWVVVELDETPDSAAVLQFAVEEARLRTAPLRVLGTWQPHDTGDAVEQGDRRVRAQLDRRLETWRHRYPDLDVAPVAVHGSGLDWLAGHAAAIGLMVIGARNIVAVTELLGPAGLAALPGTSIVIVDRQRLL